MNYAEVHSDDQASGGGFLNHLPTILWQRRWLVIVPLLLCAAIGIAAAFLIPAKYRSSATLLVESAMLPTDMVGSKFDTLVDERIARIRQQILSRGDLISLIKQYDLYEGESASLTDIVDDMRENTTIEPINSGVQQNPGKSDTIAFSMSFEHADPVKAQLVMQSFVDSFLEFSATETTEQAQTAVSFLGSQEAELQTQIAGIEGQITSIKIQNGSALASAGISTISNSGSFDAQIAALQRDNALASRQASGNARNSGVAEAEGALAAARAIYSDSHPDVVLARQRVEAARRAAASSPNSGASAAAVQIASNNAQIAALGRLRSEETARSSNLSAAQSRTPAVMERISQLEARANSLRAQHQDVQARLLGARNLARLQNESKGERLSVADPPVVPDEPFWPNRLLLIGGGFALGLGIGVVLALLVDLALKPIRGVSEVEQLLGEAPLIVLPTLSRDGVVESRSPFLFWRRRARPVGN